MGLVNFLWPLMSKFPMARITPAGGGTSRRNARQVDPNVIPLAYHSPQRWHGLPKNRFRGRNAMQSFFSGNCIDAMAGHYMRSKASTNAEEFQSYVDRGNTLSYFISPTSSNHSYHWNPLKFVSPWSKCYMAFAPRRSLFEFHVPRGQFTLSMAGFDIGRAAMFWKTNVRHWFLVDTGSFAWRSCCYISELSQPFNLGVLIRCGSSRILFFAKCECH